MAAPPGIVSQIPPDSQPIINKDGRLDPQWRRFFETVWRRTGGFTDLVSGSQPYDDTLTALADLVFVADKLIFSTGPDAFATSDITVLARQLLADATAADMRTTLGAGSSADVATAQAAAVAAQADIDATQAALGALAFLNTVNDGNWSGTDLALANGGTGASTAANARTNLGLGALATQASVAAALGNQAANLIYGGPASGAAAAPAFRALAVADLPTPPTFSANRNGSNQTIASGSFVKVQCGTEEWDVGSCYDSVTNYRFTPNVAGKYMITATVSLTIVTGSTPALIASIFKNGAEFKRGGQMTYAIAAGGSSFALTVSTLVSFNGSTDYVELFAFQNTGSSETIDGTATNTWFQAAFVSR